jgi:hypothetical protein
VEASSFVETVICGDIGSRAAFRRGQPPETPEDVSHGGTAWV